MLIFFYEKGFWKYEVIPKERVSACLNDSMQYGACMDYS
jgi:hypothetical protein